MEDPKKRTTLKEFVAKICDDLRFTQSSQDMTIETSVVPHEDTLVISEIGLGPKVTIIVEPAFVDFNEVNQVLGK